MNDKPVRWNGDEELSTGETVLLQASAGTGKTYQIAHLVTRMVAEYDVPIDKILMITFTNAAVAELGTRIHQRIVDAISVLESDEAPKEQLMLTLWTDTNPGTDNEVGRSEKIRRLKKALFNFDLAPISTIHGFCQKTLTQMAFESGQDAHLDLTMDTEEILDQLVDDEFARLIAKSNKREALLISDMNWKQQIIKDVYKQMTKAVEPSIEPLLEDICMLEIIQHWLALIDEIALWLQTEQAKSILDYMRTEGAKKKAQREFVVTPR